jgi:ferredoxin-NADP reductase
LVPTNGEDLPFTYLPGQYLTFTLQIGGKVVRRSYTIASAPTRRGSCEVTVKRETHGLVSQHLHDTVKPDDLLSIAAPAGRFTFTGEGASDIALLAAGVGITPLMSILRYLTDRNWGGHIYLLYSSKTARDIIFREEIEALRSRFPNLHLTLTLTRADSAIWNGPTGRINEALLKSAIPSLTTIPFYLCGPAQMLAETRALLRELGVAESHIHTESFGVAPAAPINEQAPLTSGIRFTVAFSVSNKAAGIDSERPILTLAEELGIAVDSQCRSGICGRCKCRLLSGSVKMETQDALDDADHRDNMILLCQAKALENVTVEA